MGKQLPRHTMPRRIYLWTMTIGTTRFSAKCSLISKPAVLTPELDLHFAVQEVAVGRRLTARGLHLPAGTFQHSQPHFQPPPFDLMAGV